MDVDYLKKIYLFDDMINYIVKLSNTDYPLLILGESGVGKDFVATAIHNISKRSLFPIVNIDLSSIPVELIEKELFGAVQGAYTGLDSDYVGKFKQADKGTVILNGIEDTPYEVQGKLLKVIDTGTFYSVGSNDPITVDVRVITLSSKDIDKLVKASEFRIDLYYRINTLNLEIPPLRERKEVIEKIINDKLHLLDDTGEVYVANNDFNLLKNNQWAGNIRELLNTIERGYILRKGNKITLDSLLLSSNNNVNITSKKLKDAVNEFKAYYIANVLERNNGNVTKSAFELGIQRTYLSRLIKDLNIY